ncbi:MAG TPA: glycosyltransferase family 2 protein [Cyclobacteriaceae bacterium]|nr:glycosyltransferase family 2 protein [Cyclobacteriaceae bacterium]
MTDIAVVIPVFNEENNVSLLYDRLHGVMNSVGKTYRFVFVNDGSRDGTLQKIRELSAKDKHVKYIDLSRNFGHQVAVTAGLHFAKGKRVVIIDADLQDPPELIVDMDKKMDEGWNVVYARRKQRKGESFFKRITARMFYRLLKGITAVDIPVDTGDFRMMDWKVVEVLNRMPEQHKFIRGMVSWVGFKQTYVEYDRDQRHSGKTGYTFRKMLRFAIDGITGFSNAPLKVATWMGFGFSIISFLLILYTLYARFVSGNYVQGWASIMISILFIGGIQLICLGLIGEYIIRMDANLRQRPLYIINETNAEES